MDKLETIERLSTLPGSAPPPPQSTQEEGDTEDSNMDTDTSTGIVDFYSKNGKEIGLDTFRTIQNMDILHFGGTAKGIFHNNYHLI